MLTRAFFSFLKAHLMTTLKNYLKPTESKFLLITLTFVKYSQINSLVP